MSQLDNAMKTIENMAQQMLDLEAERDYWKTLMLQLNDALTALETERDRLRAVVRAAIAEYERDGKTISNAQHTHLGRLRAALSEGEP